MDIRLSKDDRRWLGPPASVMSMRRDDMEAEGAEPMEMPSRDLTQSSWPQPPVENVAAWRGGWGSRS
jgi:hypothetical protein